MESRHLSAEQASATPTSWASELRPKLEALAKGEALLIDVKEWEYKSPPRVIVNSLFGAGKFRSLLTEDKRAWMIQKI